MDTSRNYVGIAVQADESTPATAPEWMIPLMAGSLPTAEKTHEEVRETHKTGAETFLKEIKATADWNCFAYEELVAFLVHGILGTDTITGTTLKTHVLTQGSVLPRYTVWTFIDNGAGGYDITKHSNVLLSSLVFKADDNGAVKLEVKSEATQYEYVDTVDTASAVDLATDGHAKIITADALIKFSGASQVPVTLDDLSSFELELSRDLEPTPKFGSALPGALDAKFLKVKPKVELRGTQAQFREIMCGAIDANGIPSTPVFGSTSVKMFAAGSTEKFVEFLITKVVWKPSAVEADPEQGKYTMTCDADTDSAIPTITSVSNA